MITKEQIEQATAGRELDGCVFEYIMRPDAKWVVFPTNPMFRWLMISEDADDFAGCLPALGVELVGEHHWPPFSTDIAAAWQVVEKMRENGYWLELEESSISVLPFWTCRFLHAMDRDGECHADTALIAICKAALLAVMDGPQ